MEEKPVNISRKILGLIEIEFTLVNKTGLLIRSQMAKASIGGADIQPMFINKSYIINGKEYNVEVPYIPGSSLKGRLRSLLEVYEGYELYETSGGRIYIHVRDFIRGCKKVDHAFDNLFGSPSIDLSKVSGELKDKILEKIAPTRLIIEDIYPSKEYITKLLSISPVLSKEDFLEEKMENTIDRITGSAANPRTILRVKPDVEFKGIMNIIVYDIDLKDSNKEPLLKKYVDLIIAGLKLLEDTYLGGSGTRGYGKIKFTSIKVKVKNRKYYLGEEEAVEIGEYKSIDEMLSMKDRIVEAIAKALKESSS